MIYQTIERRKIASERHLPASNGSFVRTFSHIETLFTNLDRSSLAAPVSHSSREHYGDYVASHLAPTGSALDEGTHQLGEVTMDTDKTDNPMKEVLDGLFTLLESMETQNAAVLEFLKDQGVATDEKLAPYFDRAASASSVKWSAARARMAYLLAPPPKKATDQKEAPDAKEPPGTAAKSKDTQPKDPGTSDDELKGAEAKSTQNNSPDSKPGLESNHDAKSKAAAATQSENNQRRNPATLTSSAQSAK
jgi:hypothetical protein